MSRAAGATGPGVIDYLGVGPVWPQTTKPDAAEPAGLRRLREIVDGSPWPCVAIGGVDAERAPLVRATGAAGSRRGQRDLRPAGRGRGHPAAQAGVGQSSELEPAISSVTRAARA